MDDYFHCSSSSTGSTALGTECNSHSRSTGAVKTEEDGEESVFSSRASRSLSSYDPGYIQLPLLSIHHLLNHLITAFEPNLSTNSSCLEESCDPSTAKATAKPRSDCTSPLSCPKLSQSSIAIACMCLSSGILAINHFPENIMQYHDNGESTLGPTDASWSLGYPALMTVRMKMKYYSGFEDKNRTKYDPSLPISQWCHRKEG